MDYIQVVSFTGHRSLRLERCDPPGRRDDHVGVDTSPSQRIWYQWHQIAVPDECQSVSTIDGGDLSGNSASIRRSQIGEQTQSHIDTFLQSISRYLHGVSNKWKENVQLVVNEEFEEAGNNIITVIRDSVVARVLNILLRERRYNLRCGFWMSSADPSEAWDLCLQLCRKTFWLNGDNSVHDRDRRIYTIDLSRVARTVNTGGLSYSLYGAIYCRCRTCCNIAALLRRDDHGDTDPFPSSKWLYDIIEKHTSEVLMFIDHNKHYNNIEHQLLCVSVDAFLSYQRMKTLLERLKHADEGSIDTSHNNCFQGELSSSTSNENFTAMFLDNWDDSADNVLFLKKLLSDCGCFLLLKGSEMLFKALDAESSRLNRSALVVDLLLDYSSMWAYNDLPVYLFCCYDSEDSNNSPKEDVFYDVDVTSDNDSGVEYMLSKIRYLHYRVNLSHLSAGRGFVHERYLRQQLQLDNNDERDMLLSYLVSLTSSYDRRCLGTIVRLAACEYMSALFEGTSHLGLRDPRIFRDASLTARCFDKAVCIRPPVALSVGIPGLCVLPYSSSRRIGSYCGFPPLKTSSKGSIEICQGFDSLVLGSSLRSDLDSFVSECLTSVPSSSPPFVVVEGPSGCGKTQLVIALSHELRSTLILSNVTDFLRPQVGLSEKLVHQFFSSLERQFAFGYSHKGFVSSIPRCVVVFENTECLSDDSGCMRSLLYSLCAGLSRFRAQWEWNMSYTVLFVFTCTETGRIPERLREVCLFQLSFLMEWPTFGKEVVKRCFELYLRHRGSLLERFNELWPSWSVNARIMELRPCDIALICRTAVLWHASGVRTRISMDRSFGALALALCADPH
ncbi:uncharacterized protein BXIN_1470 [Babesia sp. Xinjiang]|uniref:uncharacterized protein n=1 Tax=Babesia sp. Xinjiang TaxID=462227 RepID=UPI000A239C31|nr:uncharacterized protein BXIN_1470 [Babesia sp. Xinjiang]ORM40014.1 hypothetical protein BXIN_1470 [Babesia sp. Xinjiang]